MTSNLPRLPNPLFKELLWEIQKPKNISLETRILSQPLLSHRLRLPTKSTKMRKKTNITEAKIVSKTKRPQKA